MKSPVTTSSQQSFESDLNQFRDQLYYYALQLTESRDDALDLVQETNYKALKHRNNKKEYEHFKAWLYTILRNTYINHLRSGYRKNTWGGIDELSLQQNIATVQESDHPDRIYYRKELQEKISLLPENFSRPLRLYLSGFSYKEIARRMQVPIGTIKSRIFLAREKIKGVYGEC